MNIENLEIDDLRKLTDLTNEYVQKFITTIDPRKYSGKVDIFVKTSLTAPSAIAAEIIDKIAGTFKLDRDEIVKLYIDKLTLALKWVDHKK